jgi:hypothetical protein
MVHQYKHGVTKILLIKTDSLLFICCDEAIIKLALFWTIVLCLIYGQFVSFSPLCFSAIRIDGCQQQRAKG